MGDHLGLPCLGTPGAVDFLANPQLPSVASMANPLGGPGRGSSLGSETHPAFIIYYRDTTLNNNGQQQLLFFLLCQLTIFNSLFTWNLLYFTEEGPQCVRYFVEGGTTTDYVQGENSENLM